MAKARRSPSRSSKKSRGILWLIAGLLLGGALMWVTQHYYYRHSKPFTGFANLFSSNKKSVDNEENKKPEVERLPKPKLDFYTILPGETVLPEPKGSGKKVAKAEPADAGVSYILQAAAFTSSEDADRLKAKLLLNGMEPHIEKITVGDKGIYYRVRLGPYSSINTLDAANAKLSGLGIKALRIRVKKTAG
jgi:cell division protein FtsN